jgi:hypothetical protein
MKRLLLLFPLFISCACVAQPVVKMRTMWDRPQVHVKFDDYIVSFTIKDINKALVLMAETGDSTYGTNCRLDTNGTYLVELYEGHSLVYQNQLQRLLHTDIGAFLLSAKHAYIVRGKHKVVPEVIMDIEPPEVDLGFVYIRFYDPKSKKLLFAGSMRRDMYNKDLGID